MLGNRGADSRGKAGLVDVIGEWAQRRVRREGSEGPASAEAAKVSDLGAWVATRRQQSQVALGPAAPRTNPPSSPQGRRRERADDLVLRRLRSAGGADERVGVGDRYYRRSVVARAASHSAVLPSSPSMPDLGHAPSAHVAKETDRNRAANHRGGLHKSPHHHPERGHSETPPAPPPSAPVSQHSPRRVPSPRPPSSSPLPASPSFPSSGPSQARGSPRLVRKMPSSEANALLGRLPRPRSLSSVHVAASSLAKRAAVAPRSAGRQDACSGEEGDGAVRSREAAQSLSLPSSPTTPQSNHSPRRHPLLSPAASPGAGAGPLQGRRGREEGGPRARSMSPSARLSPANGLRRAPMGGDERRRRVLEGSKDFRGAQARVVEANPTPRRRSVSSTQVGCSSSLPGGKGSPWARAGARRGEDGNRAKAGRDGMAGQADLPRRNSASPSGMMRHLSLEPRRSAGGRAMPRTKSDEDDIRPEPPGLLLRSRSHEEASAQQQQQQQQQQQAAQRLQAQVGEPRPAIIRSFSSPPVSNQSGPQPQKPAEDPQQTVNLQLYGINSSFEMVRWALRRFRRRTTHREEYRFVAGDSPGQLVDVANRRIPGDVVWFDINDQVPLWLYCALPLAKGVQRTNQFPGMVECLTKVTLDADIRQLGEFFPNGTRFQPRSWTLPADIRSLQSQALAWHGKTFILKPDEGSLGAGIVVTQHPVDTVAQLYSVLKSPRRTNTPPPPVYLMQEYVDRPLLLGGFKFDFRLYALVTSLSPLRVYLFKDGLARFCSEPYEPPTPQNVESSAVHLSNYSINKSNAAFLEPTSPDDDVASKRRVAVVMQQLHAQRDFGSVDVALVWERIRDIVAKTVIAILPRLWARYNGTFSRPHPCHCFQLIGVDVLVDAMGHPVLLEGNAAPNLEGTTIVDVDIKERVLGGLFRVLDRELQDFPPRATPTPIGRASGKVVKRLQDPGALPAFEPHKRLFLHALNLDRQRQHELGVQRLLRAHRERQERGEREREAQERQARAKVGGRAGARAKAPGSPKPKAPGSPKPKPQAPPVVGTEGAPPELPPKPDPLTSLMGTPWFPPEDVDEALRQRRHRDRLVYVPDDDPNEEFECVFDSAAADPGSELSRMHALFNSDTLHQLHALLLAQWTVGGKGVNAKAMGTSHFWRFVVELGILEMGNAALRRTDVDLVFQTACIRDPHPHQLGGETDYLQFCRALQGLAAKLFPEQSEQGAFLSLLAALRAATSKSKGEREGDKEGKDDRAGAGAGEEKGCDAQ